MVTNKKILRLAFLIIGLLVYSLSVSAQDQKIRVTVIPFSAEGVSKTAAKTFTDLFEIALIKTNHYTVVESTERDQILEAQAFTLSGCTDDSCVVEIGQLLAADQIFLGTVSALGSKTYLNIKLVDVEKGKSLKAETLGADSLEELSAIINQIIPRLEGSMGIVTITTDPRTKGKVFVDGIQYGDFPGDIELTPGEHRITVSADIGTNKWEGSAKVLVQENDSILLEIPLLSGEDRILLEKWQNDLLKLQRQLSLSTYISTTLASDVETLYTETRLVPFDAGSLPEEIEELYNTMKKRSITSSREIRIAQDDLFINYNRDLYLERKGPRQLHNIFGGILTTLGAGLAGYAGYMSLVPDYFQIIPGSISSDEALIKNIGFIGGGISLISGLVLFFTGPDVRSPTRAIENLQIEQNMLLEMGSDSTNEKWKRDIPFYGKRFSLEKIMPVNDSRILESTPTLEWNSISGANGYFVQISGIDDLLEESELLFTRGITLPLPTDYWIPPGDKRQWRVCAVDDSGLPGSWSDISVFEVTENRIVISSVPLDSEVYIDGNFMGNTPLTVDGIEAGTHTFLLQKSGYADSERTELLELGKHDLAFTLIKPNIEMVKVEPGMFLMGGMTGGSDERPAHKVEFSSSFYISKYEVGFDIYDQFTSESNRSSANDRGWGRAGMSVISVSWYDAVNFCNWLSLKEDLEPCYSISGTSVSCNFEASGYRLPTEAEWEYAARGGGKSMNYTFSGSNNAGDVAWYTEERKHPLGTKQPNEIGIYDMSGNVWEWCWDFYDQGYYLNSPSQDPTGPVSGTYRVLRGGGPKLNADNVRSAYRNYGRPSSPDKNYGFRVVAKF
jgi:formylglycine-generating enzyme required for sulfatase activity/TolB-like protein